LICKNPNKNLYRKKKSDTIRKETCLVTLNGLRIPQAEGAKYLGLHLGRRLNWQKRTLIERKQFGFQLGKIYWLLGKTQQSAENKLLYKTILESIWTYGAQPPNQILKYYKDSKINILE